MYSCSSRCFVINNRKTTRNGCIFSFTL